MEPYRENIVTLGHLLGGFEQACHRLWSAAATGNQTAGFYALFEGLNWAVAMDDRVACHWVPEGRPLSFHWRNRVSGAEVMRGVRWVRNSVRHQWSDAICERKEGEIGLEDFDPRPDAFGSIKPEVASLRWTWRSANELPATERPDAMGEAVYRELLAQRSVALTLYRLQGVFWHLWRLMEPRLVFPESAQPA